MVWDQIKSNPVEADKVWIGRALSLDGANRMHGAQACTMAPETREFASASASQAHSNSAVRRTARKFHNCTVSVGWLGLGI